VTPPTPDSAPVVVGYIRVSTGEQAESGAGLAAQTETITREAERRGWTLREIHVDAGASGKSLTGRAGLNQALADVEGGRAQVLVVSKLDRLSRSLLDFASLMERSRRKRWSLVALDLGVDTTTPAGAMVANLMATFSEYERQLIGVRTREALAAKKAAGVILGRPRSLSTDVIERIQRERDAGQTLAAIAEGLNQDLVPTAHGGRAWYPATIRQVLLTAARSSSAP
jgi:DNA invertase Pin-like site-specific DNA recombinase